MAAVIPRVGAGIPRVGAGICTGEIVLGWTGEIVLEGRETETAKTETTTRQKQPPQETTSTRQKQNSQPAQDRNRIDT
jgi:hypothetical protein